MHSPDNGLNSFFWTVGILGLICVLFLIIYHFDRPAKTAAERRRLVLCLINRREVNLRTIAWKLNLTRAKALVLVRTMEKEGTVTIRKQQGGLSGRMDRICEITPAGRKDLSLLKSQGSFETRQSS